MKCRCSTTAVLSIASLVILTAVIATAASVDMKDPRRAVGREDNVRIDAQLLQETLYPSSTVGITYQVQNLTQAPIAIADKIVDVSYDSETRTVLFAVGAEVPSATMPHLVTIAPGEKRVLTAGAIVQVNLPRTQSPFVASPRSVQIKVNVLRDVAPFAKIPQQQPMTDALFNRWVETSDSIYCNPIPVSWKPGGPSMAEAESGNWGRQSGW